MHVPWVMGICHNAWTMGHGKKVAEGAPHVGKDSAVLVEPLKGLVELLERVFGDDVLVSNITELKERCECSDDVRGDEPLNCIQVHLNQKLD